ICGNLMEASGVRAVSGIAPARMPADVMVIARGDKLKRADSRFRFGQYQQAPLYRAEEALIANLESAYGGLAVTGVQPSSRFFILEQMQLVGAPLENPGEMAVPHPWAVKVGINLGDKVTLSFLNANTGAERGAVFTVVGLYEPTYDGATPLVLVEDLQKLIRRTENNVFLVRKDPSTDINALRNWMEILFPGERVLSSSTPQEIGRTMVRDGYRQGWSALFLVGLFMGIGVVTILLSIFLERRRELAILKTIGTSNGQVAGMLGAEVAFSGSLGVGLGLVIVRLAEGRLRTSVLVGSQQFIALMAAGLTMIVMALLFAAYLPVITAKVASVNQLLYSHSIPIHISNLTTLEHPYPWTAEREQREGVRLLRLDLLEGKFDGILLKKAGDRVKQGETVAIMEGPFGLSLKCWASPVNGTIESIDQTVSGYLTIRPDHKACLSQSQTAVEPSPSDMSSTFAKLRQLLRVRPVYIVLIVVAALVGGAMVIPRPERALPITSYQPVTGLYPSYDQWVTDLNALVAAHSNIVRSEVIGSTYRGRPIYGLTITDFNAGDPEQKPGFIMTSGMHGNEAIGWRVGVGAVQELLERHESDQVIQELLRRKVIYAVLLVNPDGYQLMASEGAPYQRRNGRPVEDRDHDGMIDEDPVIYYPEMVNRTQLFFSQDWLAAHPDDPFEHPDWGQYATVEQQNGPYGADDRLYQQIDQDGDGLTGEDSYDGIDLNRNWGYEWRVMTGSTMPDYGGPEPWSEPETRAVRDFVLAHPNIKQGLDLHSGVEEILFPWAYTLTPAPDHDRLLAIGLDIQPYPKVKVYQASGLYAHGGTIIDWLYSRGTMALCFEVYEGRTTGTRQPDGSYIVEANFQWKHSPLDAESQKQTVARWVPSVIKWMIMDP
ncbi:MAG: M14 family zinc carboxypeptidase, partial [Bacillota bacterium]